MCLVVVFVVVSSLVVVSGAVVVSVTVVVSGAVVVSASVDELFSLMLTADIPQAEQNKSLLAIPSPQLKQYISAFSLLQEANEKAMNTDRIKNLISSPSC